MKSLAVLAISIAAVAVSGAARAESDYPNRPIKMILPSAPGGGGDLFGRVLAENMRKILGQPIVVENNAGASGTIAINQISKSKPDGYTFGLGTMTTTTLAPAVFEKLPYDPIKDLTTIARVGTSPIILVATSDFPANTLKEFVAAAKASKEPLMYGTWGIGSTGNFCAEILAQKAGVKLTHVPYKGTAPVVAALLGGEIKVAWLDMATGTTAVGTGKIKPIGMCTRRTSNFPDVATYKEQGIDFDQWTGWAVFGPPGMPKEIVEKLGAALRQTVEDPAVSAKMIGWGITPDYVSGPQQAEINAREIEVWKKIAKDASIKSDQ